MRFNRKHAVIIFCVKQIHNGFPVYHIKTCRSVIVMLTININSTFKVEMIKSFAPISDFCKVVTASAQAMGSIVFYTKGWECRKYGIPCFRLNNKIFPSTVINCDFYIFIFCIRNKFFKIFDCNFTVFVKAFRFGIVNTAVKNGATDN